MVRQCERPGCSETATVVYRFDAAAGLVWLESPSDEDRSAGMLCTRHADAMHVPRGWTLDDRRDSAPRLFVLPVRAPALARSAPTGRSRALAAAAGELPVDEGEQLTIDQAGRVAALADAGELHEDHDTRALPWVPYDDTSDLGGVLDAHGELLSRAFRGTERRRS